MRVQLDKDTPLIRADGCIAADISKTETVILGVDRKNYFGTNEVSSRIWKMMENQISPAAIAAVLVQEYDVEQADCLSAVLAVLEDMVDENLVQVCA
jgi:hypothetical protein